MNRLRPSSRREANECLVIQQRDAKHNREQIEERVVAGETQRQLQSHKEPEREEPRTPRQKNEEWHDEFDSEESDAGRFVRPHRKLVDIPSRPRWQRLGFIMECQRSEVVPCHVMTR